MNEQAKKASTRTRWPLIAAAALAAAAAIAWVAVSTKPAKVPLAHKVVPSAHPIGNREVRAPASSGIEFAPRSASSGSARNEREREDFISRWVVCEPSSDECLGNPVAASSYEEAVWLSRHGYPTAEQLADYEMTPTESLRDAAAAGDLASRALYGRRLVEEGDYLGGVSQLFKASEVGGYYALYELSEVYGTPGGRNYGPSEPFAYLRVAYLLGDAKAGRYLAQVLAERGGADIVEMRMIDERAAQLRKSAYGTTPVEPRP